MAPAPLLPAALAQRIDAAAVQLARAAHYENLGTFEFLVDGAGTTAFFFIEANPRLQVEHTVTEEVTGVDLVQPQLQIAARQALAELGLHQRRGAAATRLRDPGAGQHGDDGSDGSTRPAGGTLTAFDPPTGPGVRVDTFGYAGYRPARTSTRCSPR